MKRVGPLLKELWWPMALAVLFITAWFYKQELLIKLGAETAAQLKTMFPDMLGIGICLSLAYLVNRSLAAVFWNPLSRRVPVPRLLRDVVAMIIYGLAVTAIVGVVFQKPIAPYLAASGAGAIVIGLALRNVILDVFIGLAVNFDRAFQIGDFISVSGGPAGRVIEFNWRTTRLLTTEGNILVIPNGKLGESTVTNLSRPEPTSRLELSVFLDFDVPAERALRVLHAAVHSSAGKAGILENPAPTAQINGIKPEGVEYKIKYYQDPRLADSNGTPVDVLKAPSKAQHEVWKAVIDQLQRAGLQPATPKQEILHAPRALELPETQSVDDRTALLGHVELFESLTMEERMQLGQQMRERLFPAGEAVIRSGDQGDSMFVLSEGLLEVKISVKEGQTPQRVARLEAGMFFGEMSMLTGEPRSASVIAVTNVLVYEISKDVIAALIQSRPELTEMIAQTVTNRKLRNAEVVAKASTTTLAAEKKSMTAQLVGKMLSFLGLKSKEVKPTRQFVETSTVPTFS